MKLGIKPLHILLAALTGLWCLLTVGGAAFFVFNLRAVTVSKEPVTEYDVAYREWIRSEPSFKAEQIVNKKFKELTGETTYISVDPSVTVGVIKREKGWAFIRVTQPSSLSNSHVGWIPENALASGNPTKKAGGWIASNCHVYDDADEKSLIIGNLNKGSAVDIKDDGSGWLELVTAPIYEGNWNRYPEVFLEGLDWEGGLYIQKENFTQNFDLVKYD